MAAQTLSCPKCRTEVRPPDQAGPGQLRCPRCQCRIEVEAYPALFASPRIGRVGEPLVEAGEASCFFHPEKRAVIACESCGRFLCSLCDLEMQGSHICPTCLAAGRKKGALQNLDQFRISWPGIAVLMAIALPIVFYPLTPVFALGALVAVGVGLRQPGSITGRRKILLYIVAIVFALAEIVACFYLGNYVLKHFFSVSRP
jgi:hypothetical protein